MPEADFRLLRFQIVDGDIVDLKQKRPAVGKTAFHEILYHLLLPVDGNPLVHERLEIDAMEIAVDADINPPMQHPLALQTRTDAHFTEQIGRPMLDQPGADSVFDVIATSIFDDY